MRGFGRVGILPGVRAERSRCAVGDGHEAHGELRVRVGVEREEGCAVQPRAGAGAREAAEHDERVVRAQRYGCEG